MKYLSKVKFEQKFIKFKFNYYLNYHNLTPLLNLNGSLSGSKFLFYLTHT